jgi:hypothetical protein
VLHETPYQLSKKIRFFGELIANNRSKPAKTTPSLQEPNVFWRDGILKLEISSIIAKQ